MIHRFSGAEFATLFVPVSDSLWRSSTSDIWRLVMFAAYELTVIQGVRKGGLGERT